LRSSRKSHDQLPGISYKAAGEIIATHPTMYASGEITRHAACSRYDEDHHAAVNVDIHWQACQDRRPDETHA